MKVYLGNSQDVVIDVDEINVHPIGSSIGRTSNAAHRNAYLSACWNGLKYTCKYFYYKISKLRTTCFTKEEAEKLARRHNKDHSSNTYYSSISVNVSNIDKTIMTRFRYIQPKIDYLAQNVPIDPRFLGLWLGDGTASNTAITNIDKVVVDYILQHAKSHGMAVKNTKGNISYFTIKESMLKGGTNPLLDKLRALNVLSNKHIPKIYLENSVEVRLQVLAGLIDTDGYLHKNNYEIVQKSPQLAADIVTLANSLGFFCRTVDKIAYASNTVNKTKRAYKRVYVFPGYHTPTIPLLIDYKKLPENPVFNGITFSLAKTKTSHTHVWSTEMKDNFDNIVQKYMNKGRVAWTKIVENEEMYAHLSTEAMRHEYANRRKAAAQAPPLDLSGKTSP